MSRNRPARRSGMDFPGSRWGYLRRRELSRLWPTTLQRNTRPRQSWILQDPCHSIFSSHFHLGSKVLPILISWAIDGRATHTKLTEVCERSCLLLATNCPTQPVPSPVSCLHFSLLTATIENLTFDRDECFGHSSLGLVFHSTLQNATMLHVPERRRKDHLNLLSKSR